MLHLKIKYEVSHFSTCAATQGIAVIIDTPQCSGASQLVMPPICPVLIKSNKSKPIPLKLSMGVLENYKLE